MTRQSPDYTDADFAADRPRRRRLDSLQPTPRAVLEAVGEILAEQRAVIAELRARVEALERGDKRLKVVPPTPPAMIA